MFFPLKLSIDRRGLAILRFKGKNIGRGARRPPPAYEGARKFLPPTLRLRLINKFRPKGSS
uniref:Uncharacterized protein n=1 Tax=Haematococcus lacustris TaxID=44745 RepID=A0A2K9YRS9_HAELA|nr:hypothetical protein SG3EUKT975004.1 [Haematococcus lacustris]AUW36457.1 hypothetical protein SG3EUKT975004.1 [Haematococcus lacustris]